MIPTNARRPPPAVIVVLLHAVVFVALAWWSWRKWPDPLIDFGRELYLPWQIATGKVLYRDLASLFGPLSPYLNAAFFRAFGVSLTTIVFCNLAVLALVVAGIHQLLRLSCGLFAATTATLSALLLFGFSQYVSVGNYNFVCPYSHEATHGVALSVGVLLAAHYGFLRRRPWLFALAGAGFGLTLLTKPEVALALALAVVVGFMAIASLGAEDRAALLRSALLFFFASLLPPLAFIVYFAMQMPAPSALRATAGAWTPLWTAGVGGGEFYLRATGLDRAATHISRMIGMFAGFIGFVVAAALVARLAGGAAGWRTARLQRLAWVPFVALAIVVVPWASFPRALPLTTLAALVAIAVLFARSRHDRRAALELTPALMWTAFALALLAKMGLNARLFHYGFYLALPATTVLIVLLTGLIPRWLQERSTVEAGRAFRRIAAWTIAAAIAPYLVLSQSWYSTKTLEVGTGGDRFYASAPPNQWQGEAVREAMALIDSASGPEARVAVLPEGVMLNYLARRESPLRVITLMPPEWVVYGEPDVLRALESDPPKLVLLVRKDMTEYGYPSFGADPRYGLRISRWIDAHYQSIATIPPDARGTEDEGILVLRLRGRD